MDADGQRGNERGPFTLNKGYEVEPYKESGMGNTPPTLTFVKDGPVVTGPPIGISHTSAGPWGSR